MMSMSGGGIHEYVRMMGVSGAVRGGTQAGPGQNKTITFIVIIIA